MTSSPERIYLNVAPEERAEAAAAGAIWENGSECFYITLDMLHEDFIKWFPEELDEEFGIASAAAYVATASTNCHRCRAAIEIICIYCEHGTDRKQPLANFTVSNISGMDEGLSQQLSRWPHFRKGRNAFDHPFYFANYCPNCHTAQQEARLHEEPDGPFSANPAAPPEAVHLIPLNGLIRLSGDCHFAL